MRISDEEQRLDDPEVRGRYSGSIDPVDVLRWRSDPEALGSDGSRSPVARAAELRPIIYGRADTHEEIRRRDAAAALAESLLAGWAADCAALDAARLEPAQAAVPSPPRKRVRSRLILIGCVVAAALVVAGILVQAHAGEQVAADSASSTPQPLATPFRAVIPSASAVPTAAPPVSTPTPEPEQTDFRRRYFEENIHSILQVPLNGAPIDNANGTVTVDDYGVPLSYVVASGDVFELIAKRFDLGTDYLASINAVRRDNPTELFVGDTINLGATTILRIGDQNGVVYNHTDRLPDPHLPQD